MKKNYFLGAAAAFGLFAFSSCSSDNDLIPEPDLMTGDQVIVLDMQDTDVLSTKSRPLYSTSNKGAEQVTDVQLLVFGYNQTANQYEYVKKLTAISNWNNTSSEYAYGRKKEFKLTGDDKLAKSTATPAGTGYSKYIILAVGQDESNTNADPAPFNIITANSGSKLVSALANADWTPKTTWNVASGAGNGFLKTADVTGDAGEIFSGVSTPIEFTADGGFSTTVLLKRQVAGVMGYFNRIPSEVKTAAATTNTPVTGIRLVSAAKNTALDLSIVLDQQKDDATHGQPGNQTTEKVVNGFPSNTGVAVTPDVTFENTAVKAHTVYQIDLRKWFKWDETASKWDNSALLPEVGEDGIQLLGNVAGWHNALDASNSANITVADGAVFAGKFVIPFANNKSVSAVNNTFELQLLDKDNNILKAWDVKLDPLSQGKEDGDKVYSVYRNHLYQIGKRGSGDTPTNPGVDPDKPQPLDKDQELIIKINDQWEFIHDMEIE